MWKSIPEQFLSRLRRPVFETAVRVRISEKAGCTGIPDKLPRQSFTEQNDPGPDPEGVSDAFGDALSGLLAFLFAD